MLFFVKTSLCKSPHIIRKASIPYTNACANLSQAKKSQKDSGRLTPPIVDKMVTNMPHRIAGKYDFKVTYIRVDVKKYLFGVCSFFFFEKKIFFL